MKKSGFFFSWKFRLLLHTLFVPICFWSSPFQNFEFRLLYIVYHTITVRILLLHTRSISLGILDYQLLWQNVNVNFFPLLMLLLYVYYTVIHNYKTQTKLLKYIWESEKNFASWIVIFFCMRFIAKCSPSSSANRRLHKQTAV